MAGSFLRVEIAEGGIIEAKPAVMHCREHDVSHPGSHSKITDRVGVEPGASESIGQLAVCIRRNLFAVHHPFAAGQKTVESVVDEKLIADRKSTRLNSSHIPLSRM